MTESQLFQGIPSSDIQDMLTCFHAKQRTVQAGEVILSYDAAHPHLCILVKGKAHISSTDANGGFAVLSLLKEGDVFGEAFGAPPAYLALDAEADTDCSVLSISFEAVTHPCQRCCERHTRLWQNLLRLSAQKMKELTVHIHILTQRSVRERLTAYLTDCREQSPSPSFEINMSLVDLSSYLNVDRSSLMREIRNMKAEGLILSSGRHFTLL